MNRKKCINWHGLPCMIVSSEEGGKAAIFTNIDGNFIVCETDTLRLDSPTLFSEMEEAHGFECLSKKIPVQDEFTMVLSLTEKCNAACKYCFLDAHRLGNTMSLPLLHKSIEYVAENYPGRKINLAAFGGEPTVVPELLYEMVKFGKYKLGDCCRFSITTNGYFDDEVCSFLIDNNFSISLSMDGVEVVQMHQRPSSISFQQLEKNILRLSEGKCDLKIRCTVTEYSLDYMVDTVEYLSGLGVKHIHFEPVTPGGRAEISTPYTRQPNPETFADTLFKCIDLGAKCNVDVICFPYMNIMNAPIVFCDGNIHNRLVVGATGVLSTCVEVQDYSHILYDALGVGYYDAAAESFIFGFENRRPLSRGCVNRNLKEECKDCAFHFFCAGGCPTRNYRGSDSTEIISRYRCKIMQLVMPNILERYYNSTYLS